MQKNRNKKEDVLMYVLQTVDKVLGILPRIFL